VPPGGLVLDLYAGLGSVPEAVVMAGEGRRYIGAEIDEDRHAAALAIVRRASL
jgi:tRNA/tmRNA/rRNA uracil-C5-methylase (TrmA/RlmC/RlmD family)